jgi:uncharacterized protein (UPF0548 family)
MPNVFPGPLLRAKPNPDETRDWLALQTTAPWTYSPVEGTRTGVPTPGYNRDMYEIRTGEGPEAFARTRDAIRRWVMFDLGWTRIVQAPTPPVSGELAAVAICFGLWWINSCRIVHVLDEPDRFGFAYGTLPGHVESGEELFLAERRADGSVWFAIHAYSRPRHALTWIGYPLVRRLQRRFGRDACARVRREVAGTDA